MTIQSVLCVSGGSPEEINALNAVIEFSRLNGSNLQLLHILGDPQAFADNESIGATDLHPATDASGQKPRDEDEYLDEEEDDEDDSGRKDETVSETENEEEDEDEEEEEFEETYESEADRVRQIADSIVDAVTENGVCRLSDLESDGFAAEDIVRCWRPAKQLAELKLAANGRIDRASAAVG